MKIRHLMMEFHGRGGITQTPSLRIALHDLKLDHLHVIYPGDRHYPLADNVDVIPIANFVGANKVR